MRKLVCLVIAAVVLPAVQAHALNQSVHYQISYDSCLARGAPEAFCDQVGVASHNVDDYEFNILAAHGQMEVGQTACDGADAAIWRGFWLGQQIRHSVGAVAYESSRANITTLAQFVGRTLHLVQDNCAHSGMTNPQHAWKSLDDLCEGTHESPDIAPAAAVCARQETDAVLDAVIDSLHDWGGEMSALSNIEDHENHLTDYNDACNYLGSASQWNGEDRRWDNNIVRPFLRSEIVSAIARDDATHAYLCDTTPDEVLVGYDPDVDVSNGPNRCVLISAVCLGKADGEGTPTDTVPKPPQHGGCQAGGDASAPAMLGILLFACTRRRRR